MQQEDKVGSSGADSLRAALPWWLPTVPRTTISPGARMGTNTFSV